MASCGSPDRLLHHHKTKGGLPAIAASEVFAGAGDAEAGLQQMSRLSQQHRVHCAQQPHAEQRELQRRRRRTGEEHRSPWKEQASGSYVRHAFPRSSPYQSIITPSAPAWDLPFRETVRRRLSIPYACSLLFLLAIQGIVVIFCGEAPSVHALVVETDRQSGGATLTNAGSQGVSPVEEGKSGLLTSVDRGRKDASSPFSLSPAPVTARKAQKTGATTKTAEVCEFTWSGSRILALGDLHGDLLNCILLLCAAGLVDPSSHSWRGGDALLIQTGDINDRGPQGVALLDFFARLTAEAHAAGGRVLQLLGNHDIMNICGDFRYAHSAETAGLGGVSGRRKAFHGTEGRYGRMMSSFLVAAKVNDIVFSHAGIPHSFAVWGLPTITHRLRVELANDCALSKVAAAYAAVGSPVGGASSAVTGPDGPLWTRGFALGPLAKICEEVGRTLAALQAQKMVIGHTVQESGRIEAYCGGQLIAIDTGVSRFVSNQPKMLEIRGGNFFELGVQPVRPGESVTTAFTTAALRAVRRPLDIPPLKVPASRPEEPAPRPRRPRAPAQQQGGLPSRADEL